MNPIKHSECNFVLTAPPGMEGCVDLHALRMTQPIPGMPLELNLVQTTGFQSFWKPEPAELEALNAGHPILLTIFGGSHPPVSVQVAAVKE